MRIDLRQFRLLLIAVLPMALFACASNDGAQTEVQNITEAYEMAQTSVANGNYRRGIQVFEAIQARYPFSDLSRQIQLELMYAYYKGGQREEAVEAADTFMQENPIHPKVDYALYIKGLAYYEEGPGILERIFRKDLVERRDLAVLELRDQAAVADRVVVVEEVTDECQVDDGQGCHAAGQPHRPGQGRARRA